MQSFFDGIPKELEEAAHDGRLHPRAGTLEGDPALTLPGMGATLGFVFTAAWSEILFALMLVRDEDG
jgi:multiple sugar transport system permease protein